MVPKSANARRTVSEGQVDQVTEIECKRREVIKWAKLQPGF